MNIIMEIKPPLTISGITPKDSSLPTVPVEAIKIPADWLAGKLFEIIISRLAGQQLFFELNGTPVHAAKPEGLQANPGDRLLLQVLQTAPQHELKIIRHIPAAQTATIIDRALQQLITKLPPAQQTEPARLFSMLAKIAMTPVNTQPELSPVIIREAREILNALPSPYQLRDGQSLQKNLQLSGAFTEHLLSAMESRNQPLLNDLRMHLFRLADKVRHAIELSYPHVPGKQASSSHETVSTAAFSRLVTPVQSHDRQPVTPDRERHQAPVDGDTLPDMLQEKLLENIERTILRQQVQQLQHAQAEHAGKTQLVLDLPVKDQQQVDLFQLQIEKDPQSHSEAESAGTEHWRVTISFDFPAFGKITAKLWLHDRQLSTRFEIRRNHTRDVFSRELHALEEKLKEKGFTDTQLLVTPEITTNHQLNRQYGLE